MSTTGETIGRQAVVAYASQKNAMLGKGAVEMLLAQGEHHAELLDAYLEKYPDEMVVSVEKLSALIVQKTTKLPESATKTGTAAETHGEAGTQTVTVTRPTTKPLAAERAGRWRVMEEYDITNQSLSEGKVTNFLEMFRDKFEFLAPLIKKRQGFDTKAISRLDRVARNHEVHIVGMVRDRQKTKNGHFVLKLEDLDAECTVLVMKDDEKTMKIAAQVLFDEVIGVKGVKGNNDLVIAKEFIWPDLPQRPVRKISEPVSLAIASDLHVGSKLFLEKEVQKFLDWLNGKYGGEKEREKVGRIKYLIMPGDNVDGVGVYPNQLEELEIRDIYKQYDKFCDLMEQVPDHMEVFICPGQHDAVRRADPQPAVPKEFVKRLAERGNFHFVGSPGWVEIEGFKTMMYHGASMHEVYTHVPGLDVNKPQLALEQVLKRRCVMTGFGVRQPYAPEKKDFTLIREHPDLYVGGDMHHNGYSVYKGTIVMNGGTFQELTKFQAELGHVVQPGIVATLDLDTSKITENHFYKKPESTPRENDGA